MKQDNLSNKKQSNSTRKNWTTTQWKAGIKKIMKVGVSKETAQHLLDIELLKIAVKASLKQADKLSKRYK